MFPTLHIVGHVVAAANDPARKRYRNFALTDDAVTRLVDQGQPHAEVEAPQEISVPRAATGLGPPTRSHRPDTPSVIAGIAHPQVAPMTAGG